jgi:predicted ATPase
VRIYLYAGSVLIAFLALAGVISIQTALLSAFCGGLIIMGLIWTLIQQRKAILLNLEEPEVRKRAHQAMLAYLHEVDPDTFACEGIQRIAGKHREEHP